MSSWLYIYIENTEQCILGLFHGYIPLGFVVSWHALKLYLQQLLDLSKYVS